MIGEDFFVPDYVRVVNLYYEQKLLFQWDRTIVISQCSFQGLADIYNNTVAQENKDLGSQFDVSSSWISDRCVANAWRWYSCIKFHAHRDLELRYGSHQGVASLITDMVALQRQHGFLSKSEHRCDVQGCGGADEDGNVYDMVCTDGIQTISSAVWAAQYMGYSEQPCWEALPNKQSRLCVSHHRYEDVCAIYQCDQPVAEDMKTCERHMDYERAKDAERTAEGSRYAQQQRLHRAAGPHQYQG